MTVQGTVTHVLERPGSGRWSRLRRLSLVMGVGSAVLLGCHGTDATGVPAFKTTDPYTFLRLNVRGAVLSTIAPYDTLQLIPTAYDANGNVIPLPGPVSYAVNDTTLKVSASGLLQITSKPGQTAAVVVSVQDTLENLTHTDTAFIAGTTTLPSAPLASFSIQPTGTDSAVLDLENGTKTLTVTAHDATGKVLPTTSLKIHYASENIPVATINATSGAVTAVYPGTVRLTASTTYYGVTKTDSLQFRIGYPDTTNLTTVAAVLPNGSYRYSWTVGNLVIGVGKTVIFRIPYLQFQTGVSLLYAGVDLPTGDRLINEGVSVVFDDSSVARASSLSATILAAQFASTGTGNVSLQVPDSVVVVDSVSLTTAQGQYSVKFTNYCKSAGFPCATARAFPTAGTYHFHSATTGAAGVITVVAP